MVLHHSHSYPNKGNGFGVLGPCLRTTIRWWEHVAEDGLHSPVSQESEKGLQERARRRYSPKHPPPLTHFLRLGHIEPLPSLFKQHVQLESSIQHQEPVGGTSRLSLNSWEAGELARVVGRTLHGKVPLTPALSQHGPPSQPTHGSARWSQAQ